MLEDLRVGALRVVGHVEQQWDGAGLAVARLKRDHLQSK